MTVLSAGQFDCSDMDNVPKRHVDSVCRRVPKRPTGFAKIQTSGPPAASKLRFSAAIAVNPLLASAKALGAFMAPAKHSRAPRPSFLLCDEAANSPAPLIRHSLYHGDKLSRLAPPYELTPASLSLLNQEFSKRPHAWRLFCRVFVKSTRKSVMARSLASMLASSAG